ncbi:MAG: tRNA (adenosine(37)-N6)-threonylcarbamoyltransferase complex ATPase subunit type 1 TsaE [Bacteroidales bacterium]|nr:tRNA (adenosine(37)-N6)-threonylcarbamoyltransferase complex ATPase subunit type 1 TsaE [Bacteroidales bacterium]
MKEWVFTAKRLSELNGIAANVIKAAGNHRVLAFYGSMGVGKTTLIRAICRSMKVTIEVTSPTFALVNEYPSDNGLIYHFDFYRINKIGEALDFGIDEYFDSGCWCLMEWPEKVEELLPQNVVKVMLTENPDGSRTIRVENPA